jgi:Histidine kinase-, DNA gyrase B-, and HSP90-like ATPase
VPKKAIVEKIPLEPWEVGAELLDILSRGLYSDARDAVREYVQNGVDAGAQDIVISASGPALTIRDDGTGMDWETLRRARRFGLSDKTPWETVGYRGIGIYASFGMCDRLIITTRQAGINDLISLRLDFGRMREILDRDKQGSERFGVPLTELLNEHSEFVREEWTGAIEDHFTLVRLEGVLPPYRSQINDASGLSAYLLNTIPIAYPEESYGANVNALIRTELDLNPVRVELRIGDEPPFSVAPPLASRVLEPVHQWVVDDEGKRLAFIWYVLTSTKDRISNPKDTTDSSGVSGFLLKIKGFTLGDRTVLKNLWPAVGGGILYHHYSGEIHVCASAQVFPNAARNNLESGPETQSFLKYLREHFRTLNAQADASRDVLRIAERLSVFSDDMKGLSRKTNDPDSDAFELYRLSRNALEGIEKLGQDVKRLQASRKASHLTSEQSESLGAAAHELLELKKHAASITQTANKRTRAARGATPDSATVPPEAAWLEKTQSLLDKWLADSLVEAVSDAANEMRRAVSLHLVPSAVSILDGLKADGLLLPGDLESCRRELRLLIGWSPDAPVSLRESLGDEGISPLTSREEALVKGFDQGLLGGLGGRGQSYESMLRSVVDKLLEEDALK